MSIQCQAYSDDMIEPMDVLKSRLDSFPATSWVVQQSNEIIGYLVGYYSEVGKVSPLNAPFAKYEKPNCLYLHDLALGVAARGQGVAKTLIASAEAHARALLLRTMSLVSVQNSVAFWDRVGFEVFSPLTHTEQSNLQGYSGEPTYMIKRLCD